SSKYEVGRLQDAGIAEADEGNAVGRVKLDPGVGARVDERQVGDALEAIGAHVDPVVIALAEVMDEVGAVVGVQRGQGFAAPRAATASASKGTSPDPTGDHREAERLSRLALSCGATRASVPPRSPPGMGS